MKKILILTIFAVLMLCCIVGCGAKRDPKYFGKWEADYMTSKGEKITAMLGMPLSALFRFEIKEDGKATWISAVDNNIIQNANSNMEITWKETKTDVIEFKVTDLNGEEQTQTMDLHYRDGMLAIEEEGSAIYLKKVDEFTPIDSDALNAAAGAIQNFGVDQQ